MEIPRIDVSSQFGPATAERSATDGAIAAAASASGFMTIHGFPADVPIGAAARRELLRLFTLPDAGKRRLYRRKFDDARPNLYRGWFPLQNGALSYKEGIDIGPDVADADWRPDPDDPLTEPTPLPAEADLPGWRATAAAYFAGMERLGGALLRSLARSLGLAETHFDEAFAGGISTLRMIRYPVRTPESMEGVDPAKLHVMHNGRPLHIIGGAHVDSGFVTLLAQDGVEGLQAKAHDGTWVDVPPAEGTLAVNFGGLLERWTAGRIRATEHRVVGPGRERFSIPFFHEPRVDAVIAPLPGSPDFAPFAYGDHLWAAMVKFPEFRGMENLRRPRGKAAENASPPAAKTLAHDTARRPC